MASASHFDAAPLALVIALVALGACGGRAASTTTGSSSDPGSASGADASTTRPGDGGGGGDDEGGDRTFGDGSSYDAVPPKIIQNGPAPAGLAPGSLLPGTCPIALPAAGDACNVAGARCSYGNSESPDLRCRDWVDCSGEVWVPEPQTTATCTSFTPVCSAGKVEDLRACHFDCHFDDGTVCECGVGQTICAKPTVDPNCPLFPPNQGAACASDARCMYGFAGGMCGHDGMYAWCLGNVWVTAGDGCSD